MFGDWFDCKEVDALVDSIVADLVKRFPPGQVDLSVEKAAKRLKGVHNEAFNRVENFARTRPLNLYKKAHLGNRFKWSLREAGYAGEFADALASEFLTLATYASAARNKPKS
ncbi:MAG TPA: hypothetical protein VEF92_06655 [Burkholderiales bacterium]|nr:hypothetical protein [Burkholderiales bacterium]HYA47216.1 hypothetical protein [Burkholderiales bacterium]